MPTAVMCVSPTGDNSNDGRTWNYPKEDVLGAFDALPSSGGTILFESGSYVDSANTTRGLWLAGANDPQFGSLPTGWRQEKPLSLVGAAVNNFSGAPFAPSATLNGGSPTDITKPLIWIAGSNKPQSFENLSNSSVSKGLVLGLQSDGSGSTNNSGFKFKNCAWRCNQLLGVGPVVDITSAYWLKMVDCTTSANEQAAWDADEAVGILIRGDANGEGIIFLNEHEFNGGGGVKNYSSASLKITLLNPTQEGKTTGDLTTGPVYWVPDDDAVEGHAIIINPTQADASIRKPTVMVAEGNDPSNVIVIGCDDWEGPCTPIGSYKNRHDAMNKTPDGENSQGFNHGKVFGQSEAARQQGGAVAVRVPNLASHDPSTWAASGTKTTGLEDKYGGTQAAQIADNNSFLTFYAASGTDPAAGDWLLGGVFHKRAGSQHPSWVSRSVMQVSVTGAGNLITLADGTTGTSVSKTPDYLGEGEWNWDFILTRVSAFPTTAGNVQFHGYGDTGEEMIYCFPTVAILPAAWTKSEARAYARVVGPWSKNATVGELTTLDNQKYHALGGLRVGGGGTISKVLTASTTYDPANMATDGSSTGTTLTVTGAAVGDPCFAGLSTLTTQAVLITAHVSAADTVRVDLLNKSGGALDLGSGTLKVRVLQ